MWAAPDAMLAEHCGTWERDWGVRLSEATMSCALRKLGWSLFYRIRHRQRTERGRAHRLAGRGGRVVVLDNLSVHKGERARGLVEAAGCHLLFLPVSSPDLNPIALAFAKLKQALRRAPARTFDALVAAIDKALATITEANARGFFAHCGFSLPDQPL